MQEKKSYWVKFVLCKEVNIKLNLDIIIIIIIQLIIDLSLHDNNIIIYHTLYHVYNWWASMLINSVDLMMINNYYLTII